MPTGVGAIQEKRRKPLTLKQITLEKASRFIALVIGQSGIGKTSLLRTIPDNEPVCVVSAEAGLLCVRDLVESGKVRGFEVNSFADLADIYSYLTTEGKGIFRWVFVDSLTEIAARCLESLKVKYPDKSHSFQLWGEYAEKVVGLIKAYRDMPDFNVIFSCLSTVEKDEMNRRFTGPLMSGSSVKELLSSLFDEVLYMVSLPDSEGKEHRAFITQPWTQYPGKDRSGKLALVEQPHLGVIAQKILGGAAQ